MLNLQFFVREQGVCVAKVRHLIKGGDVRVNQIIETSLSGNKMCILKSLRPCIFLSVLSVVMLSAYIVFFLSPSLGDLIIGNAEHEAVRVANHLSAHLAAGTTELTKDSIPVELKNNDNRIIDRLALWKLKIFSPAGEVIYSSDSKDVGERNRKGYFVETVAGGRVYTKLVKKGYQSLEDRSISVDVVETYVPIMKDNEFIGAFGIYYDITGTRNRLKTLMSQVYTVLSIISIIILLAIVKVSLKARKNIIERELYEERLHQAAMTDELTGLFNRRGFLAMAEKQVNIAERMGEELYLLFADIDDLKVINDNLGHKIGDLTIIEAAQVLRMTFRKTDILSRIGGDEFAVLLTCDPDENRKKIAIQRLEGNLKLRNKLAGREYELQISTGIIYCGPDSPCSIEELVSRADLLMYKDKKNRKSNSMASCKNFNDGLTSNKSFVHKCSDFYPTTCI